MTHADVQTWLDDRADGMAALLDALVRVPTENPPGRELGRCARVLRDALDRLGFAPELIELPSPGGLDAPAIVRGTVGSGAELRLRPRALRRGAGPERLAVRARAS